MYVALSYRCVFLYQSYSCFLFSQSVAKFNCTVPGTLVSFHEECNIATTSTISTTALPPTTLGLTTTDILSPTSGLEIGRTYFLIVVICGVLAVVLVIAILVVCLSVCLLRRKVKPIASSVQMTSLGGEVSCKDESSLQGSVYVHIAVM